MSKKIKTKSGFTLIETLFYIFVFAIFSVLVTNALITLTRSFRETASYGDIIKGASVMERITREIKQADSIGSISTNSLRLNTTDEGGSIITLQFNLSGSDIIVLENGVSQGNLNSANIYVSSLTFAQVTTTSGAAVRVTLSLYSKRDSASKVYDFYDTLVLRGSY